MNGMTIDITHAGETILGHAEMEAEAKQEEGDALGTGHGRDLPRLVVVVETETHGGPGRSHHCDASDLCREGGSGRHLRLALRPEAVRDLVLVSRAHRPLPIRQGAKKGQALISRRCCRKTMLCNS